MPDPVFAKGLNNPRYNDEVIVRTKQAINQCADYGVPSVIAFTGYKWLDADHPESGAIPLEQGAANTVKGLKELAQHAERKSVNIVLEIGYEGYVGQEFIPTRNPEEGLAQAVALCDV